MSAAPVIEIGGRTLRFTNPDKVLWPGEGLTKLDLVEYYRAVAPALLPHLRNRPLTVKRYPNGIEGERLMRVFVKVLAGIHALIHCS